MESAAHRPSLDGRSSTMQSAFTCFRFLPRSQMARDGSVGPADGANHEGLVPYSYCLTAAGGDSCSEKNETESVQWHTQGKV